MELELEALEMLPEESGLTGCGIVSCDIFSCGIVSCDSITCGIVSCEFSTHMTIQ
jgi:hypothetical protein